MRPCSEWPASAVPARVLAEGPRLRVLIVTDEMEVGGTQRQIVGLARGLDPRLHEVTVAYFRHRSHFVDELEAAGVRVVHIPKRGRVDAHFVAALRRELVRGRYDIVHAFAFSAELWTTLALAGIGRTRRPRLVTSVRGTYQWYGAWQWRIKRWVTARSARVVANSRSGARYACERMGLPALRIDVVYNGLEPLRPLPDARARLRLQWSIGATEPVVLFVGRLVPIKDVSTLLRAMREPAAHRAGLRLVICGDGPERAALEAQVRDAGLPDRVAFLGERADVADLVEAADMLVLPSVQEGLSNVILEAMRGARPVIASRAGGNVELVDEGRTGLLFEVGDAAALALAMARLADDTITRQRLGAAAAEHVQRMFSLDSMVSAFAGLYREAVCGEGRSAGRSS